MDDPMDKPEPSSAPLPGAAEAGMAGSRSQGDQRWDGSISKNRMGHLATVPVTVRWDSAKIVQQALTRENLLEPAEVAKALSTSFVLSVSGLLPANQSATPASIRPNSTSDAESNARSSEENLEAFMANSRLLVKGQPSLQPENAKIDPTTGVVYLFFPRSDSLQVHKREVMFVTRYGTMNVQARFRPKDMVVSGQPDL